MHEIASMMQMRYDFVYVGPQLDGQMYLVVLYDISLVVIYKILERD